MTDDFDMCFSRDFFHVMSSYKSVIIDIFCVIVIQAVSLLLFSFYFVVGITDM